MVLTEEANAITWERGSGYRADGPSGTFRETVHRLIPFLRPQITPVAHVALLAFAVSSSHSGPDPMCSQTRAMAPTIVSWTARILKLST